MSMSFELSFGKSTSRQYDRAVRVAESMPGYHEEGEGKDAVHRVAVALSCADEATWAKLNQLMPLVSGWRSTKITLGGQAVNYWAVAAQVAQIKACHARKVQQGAGDYYCSGKSAPLGEATHFGCRFCKGVSLRLTSYHETSWLQFGTLTPERDVFQVDKAGIFQALQGQTDKACTFCPAFSWPRVRAEVDDLPVRIALGEHSKFEVKYAEINPDKVVGIKPKARSFEGGVSVVGQGREDASALARNVPNVRYADIAGQDAALEEIKNVVQLPFTHPAYFEALGVQSQGGILLYGPPGNGKTLIAKAVATESQAHWEMINGPEILS
jgi:hypothetical protein